MSAQVSRGLRILVSTPGTATGTSLYALRSTWTDENGQAVTLSHWRGRPVLVAMDYSECRFICSAYWLRLQAVQRDADARHQDVEFVILSIDPEHDSPAQWREYRSMRHIDRGNWHFLTGTRAATSEAAALLGVRWWFDEGHLMHDFKIERLDPDGHVIASMTTFDAPSEVLLGPP